MHARPCTLILGIGNTLLSDEGIGVHILNHLSAQDKLGSHVEYIDGGTLSFTLADAIARSEHFIVIDAAELQSPPGTVQVFENQAMDDYISHGNKRSVHEVGLIDLLSITLLSDALPVKRALIGIQPQQLGWGSQPTTAVAAAIPNAIFQVEDLLQRWQS